MTEIESDIETKAREYLAAFDARDLDRCMSFYDEDASLNFVYSHFKGKQQIEEWHKARFAADLRMVRMENISVSGNTVVLEGAATSKRLRAWKINSINGTVSAQFEGPKIMELEFSVRLR